MAAPPRKPIVPSVYLETTIPSYLVARLSQDGELAAKQAITRAWWENHRHRYELVTSASVLDEVRSGEGASVDAFHVAFASAYQVDFLLTWNCSHLANESSCRPIERWLRRLDKHMPNICTPTDLMEHDHGH